VQRIAVSGYDLLSFGTRPQAAIFVICFHHTNADLIAPPDHLEVPRQAFL